MTKRKHTALEVAEWMVEQVTAEDYLWQHEAVEEIESLFGEQFIYEKDGTRRIDKGVLKRFRELTEKTVVWEFFAQRWRLREPGDAPSREQR
jgi:hypothetical protein